ncbi:MAG TPA: hypothetical protein PK198_06715, partial [Saprospiraceae bacterium]|nr:hypothetical protein [Saprospiraceae bacterium]
ADTTRWRFADTTMNLNTNNIVVNFLRPGTYTVRQRAFNACGEDFETVTINIYQPPSISLTAPTPSCDQITLSSANLGFSHSGEITNFQWTFTNGTPASATGPSFSGVTFTQSGSITLQITSPCGRPKPYLWWWPVRSLLFSIRPIRHRCVPMASPLSCELLRPAESGRGLVCPTIL